MAPLGDRRVPLICTRCHDLEVRRLDLILDIPLSHRTPIVVCLFEQPGPIPVKCCGESSIEEAIVLMRALPVPVVDQAGARRVVVVRELLAIRDRGGGELVTLHLLLFVFGDVDPSSDLENNDYDENHSSKAPDDDSDDKGHGCRHAFLRIHLLPLLFLLHVLVVRSPLLFVHVVLLVVALNHFVLGLSSNGVDWLPVGRLLGRGKLGSQL